MIPPTGWDCAWAGVINQERLREVPLQGDYSNTREPYIMTTTATSARS